MRRRRLKRIHVNQHAIRANLRAGLGMRVAPIRVKVGSENHAAWSFVVRGPLESVYQPDRPLSCGARLWLETRAPVTIVGTDGTETTIE